VIAQWRTHDRVGRAGDEWPQPTHLHRGALVLDRGFNVVHVATTSRVPSTRPWPFTGCRPRVANIVQPLPQWPLAFVRVLLLFRRLPVHRPQFPTRESQLQIVVSCFNSVLVASAHDLSHHGCLTSNRAAGRAASCGRERPSPAAVLPGTSLPGCPTLRESSTELESADQGCASRAA